MGPILAIAYADGAATATATEGAATASPWTSWIMIIAIFAIMYFLMIRPQNKKDKEAKQMRSSLKPGDEVITIGGICGTVARVKEDSDRVVIMVGSDRVKIEILKNAIAEKRSTDDTSKAAERTKEAPESMKPNKKNIKKLGAKKEEETREAAKAEE